VPQADTHPAGEEAVGWLDDRMYRILKLYFFNLFRDIVEKKRFLRIFHKQVLNP